MQYTIKILNWAQAETEASTIRRRVFIEEQQVPESLEWDEYDVNSRHALAYLPDVYDPPNKQPVACGRLMASGQIGRMAVLPEWRSQGIGAQVLSALEQEAIRLEYRQVFLHAQQQALPFYERFDYHAEGETFYEADIPHLKMYKTLNS